MSSNRQQIVVYRGSERWIGYRNGELAFDLRPSYAKLHCQKLQRWGWEIVFGDEPTDTPATA